MTFFETQKLRNSEKIHRLFRFKSFHRVSCIFTYLLAASLTFFLGVPALPSGFPLYLCSHPATPPLAKDAAPIPNASRRTLEI